MKADVYTRVTDKIVADLEQGVRTWFKPWNAEHAAGRITRPLRFNGAPYNGINVLMLWAAAVERNFAAPIWMTFRQAKELGAHVRKGEKGSLVVYANTITRTETDPETGEEEDRDIPFMKAYSAFNVEQIEGLAAHYYAVAERQLDPVARIDRAERFFAATQADIRHGGNQAYYAIGTAVPGLPAGNRPPLPIKAGKWPACAHGPSSPGASRHPLAPPGIAAGRLHAPPYLR